MATGEVKMFSADRGFGFIKRDDGDGSDVFVHVSALRAAGIDDLFPGDHVSFEIVPGKSVGKVKAENIRLLQPDDGPVQFGAAP